MKAEYVVMGTDAKTGKLAFYAIDQHSGGYPYASMSLGERTDDILRAVGWLKECGPKGACHIENAGVYRIDFTPVDVSAVEEDQKLVADLIKGLSPEQLAIMKKELRK